MHCTRPLTRRKTVLFIIVYTCAIVPSLHDGSVAEIKAVSPLGCTGARSIRQNKALDWQGLIGYGDHDRDVPPQESVRALLDMIAPGSAVLAAGSLPGSFSNFTHVVDARAADDSVFRIVIRRYATFGSYDRGEKARREFKTFELLQRHGIPAPRPLYLDETGAILGTPGIVTSYVSGQLVMSPSDSLDWARALATMLANIHSISCDPAARSFLLDANSEAAWFVRAKSVPGFMSAHSEGAVVWQAVHDLMPDIQPAQPALVHLDYWPGNVLWAGERITAVVDWEEAAYGDPCIDVAYCRMHMFLSGMGQAADLFLRTYEAEIGQQVVNLGLWELAAAARPMFNPEGWEITEAPAREKFRQFIADARRRAGWRLP